MVHDASLDTLSTILGCKMAGSSADLQKTLAMATVTNPAILVARQQTILHLRTRAPTIAEKWNKRFERLAEIEREVAPFFRNDSVNKDSLEDDAIAQLSFQHQFFKPLNHVPWLLFAVSIFKIWVVPAMSIMLPIIVWILPYIILRFVHGLPITQDQYMHIIQQIMTGNLGVNAFDNIQPVVAEPLTLKGVVQYSMFAFTFIQGMVQPVQNALHLYKTDTVCTNIGRQILEVRKMIRELRADVGHMNGIHVKLAFSLEGISETDERRAFIYIQDCPENIHMVFRDIAHLEGMWRIATSKMLHPVIFSKGVFILNNCEDISLSVAASGKETVKSSLKLTDQPHAILTGPNGGGKSSFLRAVLQSVLIGHAFGFAPAKEVFMPRFTWIASGLQLRDTPGKLSMFETEVKFAAECLKAARRGGPGLVLYDELFHSTNPPDSARSAHQFLQRLWKQKEVFTLVSTHLFKLVAAAPSNVQAICCAAEKGEDGEIKYSYGVQPGICTVSSVHKVWERFGLVPGRKASASVAPASEALVASASVASSEASVASASVASASEDSR